MWVMLQQDTPDDYVLATGQTTTVRTLCEKTFGALGINLVWEDESVGEKGIDRRTGSAVAEVDPQYFRPTEVDLLLGEATKAREQLGWAPKCSLDELVEERVAADLENGRDEQMLQVQHRLNGNGKELPLSEAV